MLGCVMCGCKQARKYACICLYMCACMRIYSCVYVHACDAMQTSLHTEYACTNVKMCMYVGLHVCMCIQCMCMCMDEHSCKMHAKMEGYGRRNLSIDDFICAYLDCIAIRFPAGRGREAPCAEKDMGKCQFKTERETPTESAARSGGPNQ
jgi:hypothetical protein